MLFDIENHFVVGYGLDYMERYRGLPGINILEERPMKQILFAVALLLAAPLLPAPSKPILNRSSIKRRSPGKSRRRPIKIDNDYQGKDLVIVMVMKGAVFTVADLMRAIEVPADLEFVQCKSYHGTERGNLTSLVWMRLQLKGRDVLIVDDIFDSGQTMSSSAGCCSRQGAPFR